ncbi:MAG TPA: Ig domain-containing protein [Candidatus Binatia bacterium]|nr:Ig domain-containing protein [Candidatus Binatia bacterium]
MPGALRTSAIALLALFTAGVAARAQAGQNPAGANGGLVIQPAQLPATYPHGPYHIVLSAQGNYVPVLRWRIAGGALPPGISLDENGALHGEAARAGEFQFVVMVRDANNPPQAVQREFTIKVVEAMTLTWKVPAHVTANRIDGSVEVSNTTPEDMDFTFDVKAVADNGRATEIGYQHFPLKHGTLAMALPFGDTLPYGNYLIYVDANGEIAQRGAIYKQELKSSRPLQVAVEP